MKYIKVNVEAYFEVPDDLEITEHPEDGLECIRIGDSHYLPMIDWLEREENGVWSSAEEEVVELCSEEATITPVSQEEFDSIFDTSGKEE